MAIDVGEAVGYLKLDTQDFAEGLARSESDLKQFSGITEQLGNGITSFGQSLTRTGAEMTAAFTTPIVAAGKKAIDAYRDFESAFTGVKKTLDVTDDALREFGGSADDAYATLKTAIEGMATSTASSAEEIAHVMEISGQLGVPLGRAGKDIISFTDTMVKLGDTTDLSATEAAEALAKFMNITGTTWDEVSNLGSAIVDLGNNFATNESDIVNMSTRLASAGTVAGLTEQEILALSTAMSSVGIRAEMGGSAMSQTLAQIEKAVQKALAGDEGAIPMLNKLAEVSGMTSEEFATTWETRPIEALQSFLLGLGDLEDKGESTVLVLDELGMTGIRQSNMLRSLALAGGVLTDAINTSNEAWTLNKAMMNEAELRYGTLDSKINMVKESVKMVARDIAEILLPTFEKMLDGILKAVETWQSLDKEEKEAIVRIAAVVAAIGPLLLVFGKLTSGVGTVVTAFGKVMGVFDMFSGKTGIITGVMDKLHIKLKDTHNEASMFSEGFANAMGGAASSASAFGQTVVNTAGDVSEFDGTLVRTIKTSGTAGTSFTSMLGTLLKGGVIIAAVVAAIALLVAGFVDAYKSSEEVRNAVSQLFEVFGRFAKSVMEILQAIWKLIQPLVEVVVKVISELIQALLPPLVDLIASIQSVLEAITPILSVVFEVIGKIAGVIASILIPIVQVLAGVLGGIIEVIAAVIQAIADFLKSLFGIKDGADDVSNSVSEKLSQMFENIGKWFSETGEKIWNWLTEIKDGIVQWHKDRIYDLAVFLVDTFNSVKEWFNNLGQRVGEFFSFVRDSVVVFFQRQIENIQNFFKDVFGQQGNFFSNLINGVANFVSETIGAIGQFFRNILLAISNFFSSSDSKAMQWIGDQLFKLAGFINNMTVAIMDFFSNIIRKTGEWLGNVVKSIADFGKRLWDAGKSLFTNFFDGVKSVWDSISGWVSDKVGWIADKIGGAFSGFSNAYNGSHASGLDYVPFNGYIAQLHQGERVLTKEEAREYNSNDNGNNVGDTFVFYDTKNDPYEQARAFKRVKKEMAFG